MASPTQQIQFCTSRDGARIAYAACSAGPPLVLGAHWGTTHLNFDSESPVFGPWLRVAASPRNSASLMRVFYGLDLREIAPRIRCPTLVLHAREDAVSPFEEGRSLASLIPVARFVPLDSRNHLILESEPAWQRMVEEVNAFLPLSP